MESAVKIKDIEQSQNKKSVGLTRVLKLIAITFSVSIAVYGYYSFYKLENLKVESLIGMPIVEELTKEQITQINVDLFKLKTKLMSINLENENFPSNIEDRNALVVDKELSPEYKEKYTQFMLKVTAPWSKEDIQEAKNLVIQANVALNKINEGGFSDNFIKVFNKNMNDLDTLTKNETNVQVLNLFREKMIDTEFQHLSKKQELEKIWNLYFKEQFGSEINPVISLVLGLK